MVDIPECNNIRGAKTTFDSHKGNWKLIHDPQLKKGVARKLYRFNGVALSDPFYSVGAVRDPRKVIAHCWTHKAPLDLPVPNFKVDGNYVGTPPGREVSFTNLNDNIDADFLTDMCKKCGDLDHVEVFRDPDTRCHLRIGRAVFRNADSAQKCQARYNGKSIMGDIVTAFIDSYGRKVKRLFQEMTKKQTGESTEVSSTESAGQAASETVVFSASDRHVLSQATCLGSGAPSTSGLCSPSWLSTTPAAATPTGTIPEDPTTSGLQPLSTSFPMPAVGAAAPVTTMVNIRPDAPPMPSVILPFASNVPPPTLPPPFATAAAASLPLPFASVPPPNFWPQFRPKWPPPVPTANPPITPAFSLPPVPQAAPAAVLPIPPVLPNFAVPPPGFPSSVAVVRPTITIKIERDAESNAAYPSPLTPLPVSTVNSCPQNLRPVFPPTQTSATVQPSTSSSFDSSCSLVRAVKQESLNEDSVVKLCSFLNHGTTKAAAATATKVQPKGSRRHRKSNQSSSWQQQSDAGHKSGHISGEPRTSRSDFKHSDEIQFHSQDAGSCNNFRRREWGSSRRNRQHRRSRARWREKSGGRSRSASRRADHENEVEEHGNASAVASSGLVADESHSGHYSSWKNGLGGGSAAVSALRANLILTVPLAEQDLADSLKDKDYSSVIHCSSSPLRSVVEECLEAFCDHGSSPSTSKEKAGVDKSLRNDDYGSGSGRFRKIVEISPVATAGSSLDSRIESILKDDSCALVKVVKRFAERQRSETDDTVEAMADIDCSTPVMTISAEPPDGNRDEDEMSLSSGNSRPTTPSAYGSATATPTSSLLEGMSMLTTQTTFLPPPVVPYPPPPPPSATAGMYAAAVRPFEASSQQQYNPVLPNVIRVQPNMMWSPNSFSASSRPTRLHFPVTPPKAASTNQLPVEELMKKDVRRCVEKIFKELDAVLQKDVMKRLVFDVAFRSFDSWWSRQEQLTEFLKPKGELEMSKGITPVGSPEISKLGDSRNFEEPNSFMEMFGNLRASLPKLPSFKRKPPVRPTTPVMSPPEDSSKESDDDDASRTPSESSSTNNRSSRVTLSPTVSRSVSVYSSSTSSSPSASSDSEIEQEQEKVRVRNLEPSDRDGGEHSETSRSTAFVDSEKEEESEERPHSVLTETEDSLSRSSPEPLMLKSEVQRQEPSEAKEEQDGVLDSGEESDGEESSEDEGADAEMPAAVIVRKGKPTTPPLPPPETPISEEEVEQMVNGYADSSESSLGGIFMKDQAEEKREAEQRPSSLPPAEEAPPVVRPLPAFSPSLPTSPKATAEPKPNEEAVLSEASSGQQEVLQATVVEEKPKKEVEAAVEKATLSIPVKTFSYAYDSDCMTVDEYVPLRDDHCYFAQPNDENSKRASLPCEPVAKVQRMAEEKKGAKSAKRESKPLKAAVAVPEVTKSTASSRKRSRKQELIVEPSSPIRVISVPTPLFKARQALDETKALFEFLACGVTEEDLSYFKRAFTSVSLAERQQYPFVRLTKWLPTAPTYIPPLKKSRTSSSCSASASSKALVSPHVTGCARTEGFYRLTMKQKNTFLKKTLKSGFDDLATSMQEICVARQVAQEHRVQARSMQRRLMNNFGTIVESELLKFNQLKFRKKLVKFGKSQIHGWGLFALEDIAPDEMIVEYVGQKIRLTVAEKREKKYEKMGIGSSYLFRIDNDMVVDATKHGNMARFINHSCSPTCYAKIITVNGEKRIVIYSKQPIRCGQEITYDYKFPLEDDKITCNCGSAQCRGTLN